MAKAKATAKTKATKTLVRFIGINGTHPFHAPIVVFQFARSRKNARPVYEGLRAGTSADLKSKEPVGVNNAGEDPDNGWFLVSDDEAAKMREEIREENAGEDPDAPELWSVVMQRSANT